MTYRSLVERFCSFLEVKSHANRGTITGYKIDQRLYRQVTAVVAQCPDATEDFLAQYFLREFLKNPQDRLLRDILCAYLDKVAFFSSTSICQQYAVLNPSFAECFATAREQILHLAKLLKNYDFCRSSVKSYASLRIKSNTLEAMKDLKQRRDRASNWSLLKNTKEKKWQEVFQQAGLSSQRCNFYLGIIKTFQETYKGNKENGRLLEPNQTELQSMLQSLSNSLMSESQLLKVLNQMSEILRQSRRVKLVTLDFTQQENLATTPEVQPLGDLFSQVSIQLKQGLKTLPPAQEQLLAVYYGKVRNQTEIAQEFGIQPYQISRQLTRIRRSLLKEVKVWCEHDLNQPFPKANKEMDKLMVEWLTEYYQGYSLRQAA